MAAFSPGAPQRKTGLVIQTCSQCGAVNIPGALVCSLCDTQLPGLPETQPLPQTQPLPHTAEESWQSAEAPWPSVEEPWRTELERRMAAYRARKRRLGSLLTQNELPFIPEPLFQGTQAGPVLPTAARPRSLRLLPKSRLIQRVEIAVQQPRLNFAAECYDSPHSDSVPVANISDRARAGAVDAIFLGLACSGFLAMFHWMGGSISLSKVSLGVCAATFLLLYLVYFVLFTILAASTPGMQLCRLETVRLDGDSPETKQLVWRSFGYLVSASTLMLGFLWALWDESTLTWHDRISQTYITAEASNSRGQRPQTTLLHHNTG